MLEDDIEQLQLSKDADAKIGHKIADTSFFGYKSHIAMSDERIITSAIVTTGEKSDGKYLETLIEKSKNADMFVCPSDHLAVRKAKQGRKNVKQNQVTAYYFDVEKCKKCSKRDGCYKEGAETKSYSISIKSDLHKGQIEFEETDYFKERAKERYKIEAKNSELKHQHGYDVA